MTPETVLAVLGGTGPQGRSLARRLAIGGAKVVIGSRDAGRAEVVAKEMREDGVGVVGIDNRAAARAADIVIVAVPWDGHAQLLTELRPELAGKIVIDCVNPLGFDKQGPYALQVLEGSAAEQAKALLPDSRVVGAFHHLSAALLEDTTVESLDTDVLVLGDDREAVDVVIELSALLPGVRGVFGGRLRNAHQVEALTANLIAINKRYKAHAGVRITDI
ncbi:NADPH-dependent F420 reductase [Nocardioides sp. WS12]|uniref:NADPH-dependent F420 reductase n=1 Tax=Nocardioides sp. WS12 TaxID=2486272 RepID=UPI0015F92CAB|nr:NADPH-dependent F420 reductase [Nocardioides sp. WS12]